MSAASWNDAMTQVRRWLRSSAAAGAVAWGLFQFAGHLPSDRFVQPGAQQLMQDLVARMETLRASLPADHHIGFVTDRPAGEAAATWFPLVRYALAPVPVVPGDEPAVTVAWFVDEAALRNYAASRSSVVMATAGDGLGVLGEPDP